MSLLANYDWSLVWENRGAFLKGLLVAIEVAAVALVLSVVVGLILALARMSRPPFSWLAMIYVNVFRGVPALVSVLWVYFGISLLLGINFSVFQAAVIALVLRLTWTIAELLFILGLYCKMPWRLRTDGVSDGNRDAR